MMKGINSDMKMFAFLFLLGAALKGKNLLPSRSKFFP